MIWGTVYSLFIKTYWIWCRKDSMQTCSGGLCLEDSRQNATRQPLRCYNIVVTIMVRFSKRTRLELLWHNYTVVSCYKRTSYAPLSHSLAAKWEVALLKLLQDSLWLLSSSAITLECLSYFRLRGVYWSLLNIPSPRHHPHHRHIPEV